jgi:hypothetical protein
MFRWQVLFSLFDLEAETTVVPAQPAPLFVANVNGTAAARKPPPSKAPPPGRKVAAGSSTAGVPPAKPPASKGGQGSKQHAEHPCDALAAAVLGTITT